MTTLKQIETQLNKESKIRIRGLIKRRTETLEEFLIKFFTIWNKEGKEYETIYVNNGEEQTYCGARRSVGDLYIICKYYYPKCTLKEIRDIVFFNLFEEVSIMRSSICNQIDKRVFYQGEPPSKTCFVNKEDLDEWELTVEQWKNLK